MTLRASVTLSADPHDPVTEATFGLIWGVMAAGGDAVDLSDALIQWVRRTAPDGFTPCDMLWLRAPRRALCTRRQGHTGDHVAIDAQTLAVLVRWDDRGVERDD